MKGKTIFIQATESSRYCVFLSPIVYEITSIQEALRILDIVTGPGTLPRILIEINSNLQIAGIDISKKMIDETRKSVKHQNISFMYQKADSPLEFEDNQFGIVTFCSVLFLVDNNVKDILVSEALRVLKPTGKIIILTPSGIKSIISSIISSIIEMWQFPFNFKNWTFVI